MGQLRRQGWSYARIAEELNARGYRTGSKRFGQRLFTKDTIRAILRNAFYVAYTHDDAHGTILSEGERYRGQHLAAFSREEWEAIQQVRHASGRPSREPKEPAQPPAFAGTIVCADCGGKLGPRKGKYHAYYKDVAHLHGHPCPAGGYLQVRQEVVTEQFGELLEHISFQALPDTQEEEQHWLDVSQPSSDEISSIGDGAINPEPVDGQESSTPLSPHHFARLPEEAMAERATAHAEHLQAAAQLEEIKQAWPTASVERQRAMVQTLLEPQGLQYAVEKERIVALRPYTPFVPFLERLPGASLQQMDQGALIVLESRLEGDGQPGAETSAGRGEPPSKLAVPQVEIPAGEWGKRRRPAQRRPGPDHPASKIDSESWPEVLSRIEQGESLRQVARVYQVSHETIRRLLVTQQSTGAKHAANRVRSQGKGRRFGSAPGFKRGVKHAEIK